MSHNLQKGTLDCIVWLVESHGGETLTWQEVLESRDPLTWGKLNRDTLQNTLDFETGVPGATRTRDPLLRSYTMPLFASHFEAELLFRAYPCFSYKMTFFLQHI